MSAISLAQYEASQDDDSDEEDGNAKKRKTVLVHSNHIRRVLRNKRAFEDEFDRTHGMSLEEKAFENGVRAMTISTGPES